MASTKSSCDTEVATSAGPTCAIGSSSVDSDRLAPMSNTLSLDSRWDVESDSWKYTENPNPNIPAEQVQPMGAETTNSDWKEYCFVVVRKHPKPSKDFNTEKVAFEIFLMDPYLVKACQNVMADVRGQSWNSQPIKLDPKILVVYFPRLEKYEQNLSARTDLSEEEGQMLNSLRILLAHMRKHYEETLARIASLVKNHEITFDLLDAILLPGTVIIQPCCVTGETRAFKLLAANQRRSMDGQTFWSLHCEYLEFTVGEDAPFSQDIGGGDKAGQPIRFGMLDTEVQIPQFDGVERINSLNAYPIEFYSNPTALKAKLLERAHAWVSLCGVHHVYYKGNAGRYEWVSGKPKFRRYSVCSRIMVDKASFSRIDADYRLPEPERMLSPRTNLENGAYGLADPELLLAPPIVYGFSLTDKVWLEFSVNRATPIDWNDKAFDGLVLPKERKALLRGLIEAHSDPDAEGQTPFDDFVRGKGRGLVINLFGPPGVGKTLSAEATSETLRRPLYILGGGELGMNAAELEDALRKAFDLAAVWRAVLLIDEADVFLEQRSLHDLERNAMVAVFLRHLEYYRGILFMTTNRIRAFDEAFLSRIHVSLHFDELSMQTKEEIWRAFLRKAGLEEEKLEEEGLLSKLAEHDINGRQIKNACRTATSLAASRDEKIQYKHLEEVLDAMEEFMKDLTREQTISRPRETREETTRPGSVPSGWKKRLVGLLNKYLARFQLQST